MSKTVKTPKGTSLPLVNLKGKDYLMVGHRLQWFNETEDKFTIETTFPLLTEEQTVAHAVVTVFDKDGSVIKKASATKRETKKDFSDHTEKAETSAIGRALAMLGYGTQFALADLDEGQRLADSPMEDVKTTRPKTEYKVGDTQVGTGGASIPANETVTAETKAPAKKTSSFRKPKAEATTKSNGTSNSDESEWM